jgi:DNA-binding MarR family transcriptional regulator
MMHMHQATPSACACTALRKASRALTRLYDARLSSHGVTATQFALLRTIGRAGEAPLSALGDQLVMDRTTLYRALAPMERQGWIETRRADHGRARLARLTPGGEALALAAAPAWEAAQTEVAESLGARGVAGLVALSAEVVEAMKGRAA